MTKKIVRDDYVSTFKENQQLQFSSHENSEFENNHVQNMLKMFFQQQGKDFNFHWEEFKF